MPELPEVETIRRGLEKYLIGKKITNVEVRFQKLFTGDPGDILGVEIIAVRRFGKGLVIDFKHEISLVAHVKMTGQFIFKGESTIANLHPKLGIVGELPNKWTHVIFSLEEEKGGSGGVLYYNDIRKFGWIKVIATSEVKNLSFFKSLGKELPLKGLLGTMTPLEFEKLILSSTVAIKALLMDQQRIAGIGNIYANDGLFKAKIDPRRKANSLKRAEIKLLYQSLIEVLEKGLLHQGASDVNYLHVDGTTGNYQNHFLVYGRAGEKCLICKNTILRTVVGGRGTFYCSSCQK